MDTSPEIQTKHLPSLLLSVLGWLVVAGVAIWFFAFAKGAAYTQGFEKGVQEQNAIDQALYEDAFGADIDATPANDIVNARMVSNRANALVVEQISLGVSSPFSKPARQQTVVYDAQTQVVRRIVVGIDELVRRRAAAQERGENPALIAPFDDIPAAIGDIQPGDRLEIVAKDPFAIENDAFAASFIAIVVEPNLPNP